MPEWRESLGIMLRKAGELDKKVMFLFPDTQIKMEGFVEDINSLLNTGEVSRAVLNLLVYFAMMDKLARGYDPQNFMPGPKSLRCSRPRCYN
jgi:hypothetical protein